MSVSAHLDVLSTKHEELKNLIQQAYSNHDPDYKIAFLKKRKLHIKDEIMKLREDAEVN